MSPLLVAVPPLDPSADEARSLLRRELVRPEYHQRNLLEQLIDRLDRFVSDSVDAASRTPALSSFAAMVAALLLALALAWLISRARRSVRSAQAVGSVVEDLTVSAEELRARAERALVEGRPEDAVVDGFRALAVRQAERGYVDDLPGATAHEVAAAVGAAHPPQRDRVAGTAALFDEVLYGDHPASAVQASTVLELDDELRGRS